MNQLIKLGLKKPSFQDDLRKSVKDIFANNWTKINATIVPDPSSIQLGNEVKILEGTVLYADIVDSTILVDNFLPLFAAEIYKAFLHCAAKIVKIEGGKITAYDGDRIMAVFIGDSKNTSATRAALKIHFARNNIINPALVRQYPKTKFRLKHRVGIDTGKLSIARTGVRGSNDLVWVGRAANHAAKLAALKYPYPTIITESVYKILHNSVKISGKKNMWIPLKWADKNRLIYRSNYTWKC